MRVVTLNLWGRRGAWEERRSVLIEGLRVLRPDLVALQESVLTPAYDQVGELLGAEYQIDHQKARAAWESAHPDDPGHTFRPRNGLMNDWDWPFRRIDYIFVRCGLHGGPTLAIDSCRLIFDELVEGVWASDHFGLVADLTIPPDQEATS